MKERYAKRLKELCETNRALQSEFRNSLVHFDAKGADIERLARAESGFEMISGSLEFYAVRYYEAMEDNTRLKNEIRELKEKYEES